MPELSIRQFFNFDPNDRGLDRATKMITHFRTKWKPIIDPAVAKRNFDLLFGTWDTAPIKKMFTNDGKDANIDFRPYKVLEKYRNIILTENQDEGVNIEASAIDPSATNERKKDREILSNRKNIEKLLTTLGQSANRPPYKLKDEPDRFNGNVQKFDEMGLSDGSDEDLDFFFTNFHRLTHEIALEAPINMVFAINEIDRRMTFLNNDIIANNACSLRTYVDDISGQPVIKYISPHLVKQLGSDTTDYKNSICLGYEEQVTVQEFFRMVGSDFDINRDYNDLLLAVNFFNGKNFTGIKDGGGSLLGIGNDQKSICEFENLLTYKISVGYIEWKEMNADNYSATKANYHGNPRIMKQNPTRANSTNFVTKQDIYEVTYKSYYIATSTNLQKLFKFGKLAYQQVEGGEDEFSNYSICVIHNVGSSIAEIAEPHLIKIEKARAKHEWLLQKAKAPGFAIEIDALMDIATILVKSGNTKTDIETILKMYETSPNIVYSKMTNQGQNVGGNNMPYHELKNGMAIEAIQELTLIMKQAMEDIDEQIGFNGARTAEQAAPRSPVKLNMQAYEGSRKATAYINRMAMDLFSDAGRKVAAYTQDIIRFRKRNPVPYKWLLHALGEQTVEQLATMENIPAHRYGIFIQPLSNRFEREQILQYAEQAFANKEIKLEQLLLVKGVKSAKRAAQLLSYATRMNMRMDQQNQMSIIDKKMEMDQQIHKNAMELQMLKNKGNNEQEEIRGKYYQLTYGQQAAADMRIQAMKMDNDKEKINAKADANIKEEEAKKSTQIADSHVEVAQ